jgi:NAD(P)-dependent dehydrogenase (short-subunit alcohol dehydrogenase family)
MVNLVHLSRGACTARYAGDQTIHNQFGKLALLIDNAVVAGTGVGQPHKVNVNAVETIHASYIGTVVVTEAVLPLLQSSGKAQIINVSSSLGFGRLQYGSIWEYDPVKLLAYCASKAALKCVRGPTPPTSSATETSL